MRILDNILRDWAKDQLQKSRGIEQVREERRRKKPFLFGKCLRAALDGSQAGLTQTQDWS